MLEVILDQWYVWAYFVTTDKLLFPLYEKVESYTINLLSYLESKLKVLFEILVYFFIINLWINQFHMQYFWAK